MVRPRTLDRPRVSENPYVSTRPDYIFISFSFSSPNFILKESRALPSFELVLHKDSRYTYKCWHGITIFTNLGFPVSKLIKLTPYNVHTILHGLTCLKTRSTNQSLNTLSCVPKFRIFFHFLNKRRYRFHAFFFITIVTLLQCSNHTTIRRNESCQELSNLHWKIQSSSRSLNCAFRFLRSKSKYVTDSIFSIYLSELLQNLRSFESASIYVNL